MRRRITAVNALALLVTAGRINVLPARHPALAQSLHRLLLQAMQAESILVYEVAAEVAGLLLRFLYPLSPEGEEEVGGEGKARAGGYHEEQRPHPLVPNVDPCAQDLPRQVRDLLLTRILSTGDVDAKKGEPGPRSVVALVGRGRGGFKELLDGRQGRESRRFWLAVVAMLRKVQRIPPKTMANLLEALAESDAPHDLTLLEEVLPFLPPCLVDTSRAFLRGAWRPGVQYGGICLLRRGLRKMMEGGREGVEEGTEEGRGGRQEQVARILLVGGLLDERGEVPHRYEPHSKPCFSPLPSLDPSVCVIVASILGSHPPTSYSTALFPSMWSLKPSLFFAPFPTPTRFPFSSPPSVQPHHLSR